MRKLLSAMFVLVFTLTVLTACSAGDKGTVAEDPVTIEQINSEGRLVSRAYIESLFTDDRQRFYACYPAGFVDELCEASGVDVFDEFKKLTVLNGVFLGTSFVDEADYTLANNCDEAYMRSRISRVTGLEYSEIGLIKVEKIKAYFKSDTEEADTEFRFIVFENAGSWYMFETYRGEGT